MTLGNMRANRVRSLVVHCSNVTSRHEAIVNVDHQRDDVAVRPFGLKMRCDAVANAALTPCLTGTSTPSSFADLMAAIT